MGPPRSRQRGQQLSVEDATKNCDQLHVVLAQPEGNKRKQCLAVMGQYESFHVQKFMRLPAEKKGPVDSSLPSDGMLQQLPIPMEAQLFDLSRDSTSMPRPGGRATAEEGWRRGR